MAEQEWWDAQTCDLGVVIRKQQDEITSLKHSMLVAGERMRYLEQKLDEAQKDAERYRWLKGDGKAMAVDSFSDKYRVVDMSVNLIVTDWFDSFDQAIDVAIAAQKESL